MMCSGPFRGAQGHSNLQTRTERRGHMDWKRGEVASLASTQEPQGEQQLGASGFDGPSAPSFTFSPPRAGECPASGYGKVDSPLEPVEQAGRGRHTLRSQGNTIEGAKRAGASAGPPRNLEQPSSRAPGSPAQVLSTRSASRRRSQ